MTHSSVVGGSLARPMTGRPRGVHPQSRTLSLIGKKVNGLLGPIRGGTPNLVGQARGANELEEGSHLPSFGRTTGGSFSPQIGCPPLPPPIYVFEGTVPLEHTSFLWLEAPLSSSSHNLDLI